MKRSRNYMNEVFCFFVFFLIFLIFFFYFDFFFLFAKHITTNITITYNIALLHR